MLNPVFRRTNKPAAILKQNHTYFYKIKDQNVDFLYRVFDLGHTHLLNRKKEVI